MGIDAKAKKVRLSVLINCFRRINEEIPYTETAAAYMPNTHLYMRNRELIDSRDDRVAVAALNIGTKIRGHQERSSGVEQGAQIVIINRLPDTSQIEEGREKQGAIAPPKPIAIIE